MQKRMYYIKRLVLIAILAFTVFSSVSAADEADKAKEDADRPAGSDESGNGTTQVTGAWSYDNNANNPSMWSTLGFQQCGGDMQSPINIDTKNIHKYEYKDKDHLIFNYYKDVAEKVTVKNNGHTLVATFDYGSACWRPSVSGGQLGGTYEFEQLHSHWGKQDTDKFNEQLQFHWGRKDEDKQVGAEHTFDGKRAPLEMHMVHRNVKYKTMSEAVNKTDGIVVLAAIFEMNTNNAMPLLRSVDAVSDMVIPFNGSATLKPRALATVLPDDTTAFYHYRGSLTTPGCQQSVDWVIFEHRSHVIIGQLLMLEQLERENGKKNLHNFRPTQKLNDRKVYQMVYKKPGSVIATSSAPRKLQAMSELYGVVLTMAALYKLYWQYISKS